MPKLRKLEKRQYKEKIKAAKATKKEVTTLRKAAERMYGKGDLEGASEAFRKIRRLDPHNTIAKAYLDKKIPAKQIRKKSKEERKDAKKKKAELKKQEKLECIKSEKKAKAVKNEIAALRKAAEKMYGKGDLEGAAEAFTKIRKLDLFNKTAEVYLDKKIPAKQKKKDVEAEKKAAKKKKAELKKQEKLERIKSAKKAKAVKKEVAVLRKAAEKMYRKGDLEEASETFRKIIELEPFNKSAKIYLNKKIPAKEKKLTKKVDREKK